MLTPQAGYREGITDGKLSTLQEGFDTSFASSVPSSRRLGQLRGRANALLAILTSSSSSRQPPSSLCTTSTSSSDSDLDSGLVTAARALVSDLARVKRDDVLPIDAERIAHEKEEHGEDTAFELDHTDARAMEGLEDALGRLGGSKAPEPQGGLREEALLAALEERVRALEAQAGLAV